VTALSNSEWEERTERPGVRGGMFCSRLGGSEKGWSDLPISGDS
jgi:hypothetical protein